MDQIESMNQARSILDNSIAEHKSNPPLRWIANWAGSIASYGLLEISYMEDEGLTNSFRYKLYGWLWDTFWPIYQKYGTFYKLDTSHYWENTGAVDPDYYPWDFEDEETGDAFRIVR